MKLKLLKDWSPYYPLVWHAGYTFEMAGDAEPQKLIDEGIAIRMPDNTPSRIDATGYNGCIPPEGGNARDVALPETEFYERLGVQPEKVEPKEDYTKSGKPLKGTK